MSSFEAQAGAPVGLPALTVTSLTALDPAEPLRAEAERHGIDFVRRLFNDWATGENRFDQPGEILLGAWHGPRLVGLGGLNRDPYVVEYGIGRLRHVYVLETHRRHGVGAALVRQMLRAAEGQFQVVRLRAASPKSAALYRRLGFQEAGGTATHLITVPPAR
ncbi:GNAT family N-acetyltransferase [Methylobacterium nonmethylotrophicum]|uniref:GNAT family N-acetyltransferase n=1 Tax=Methylobacterium nonmethylotrophicum TaxID=1141884 RepID=A0A4Z0NJV7_9HYPH|nr:GNAT family N-acetyltransferase [Methylobacterium nonmethylotrophicum]TGD96320.1 GNAT family N-acetyltransferase [Methylobacterium nonmethylotrophicum]